MALSDADIAQILDRTIATIDPMLDVLASADPLDLKPRTFTDSAPGTCLERGADAASTVLNVLDWPGTAGWDALPMEDRAEWWVSRIGVVTTGGVAFPSVFGAWTKKLPMGDYLGFASQAMVLRAVSREYGVTSRAAGVTMLASILLNRDLGTQRASAALDEPMPAETKARNTAFVTRLWQIGRSLYELSRSTGERPGSPRLLSWLGWVPLLGGPASYLGEILALRRAVTACRKWIVAHPDAVEPIEH